MTSTSQTVPETAAPRAPALSPTRPFYWSLRRELWENRSIYMAPMIAAGVILFGFLISNRSMAHRMNDWRALDAVSRAGKLALPYHVAAFAIIITGVIVAVVYCLGALFGERRDRSVLFWKSLPVSDRTTVLAKASVPMLIIPAVTFAVAVGVQLIMLLLSSAVLIANGMSALPAWTEISLPRMDLAMLYAIVVVALWYAPIYGWLLLVSAWARRVTFLWAVLPVLGLCLLEGIAFDSSNLGSEVADRLGGGIAEAFKGSAFEHGGRAVYDPLSQIDPVRFLSTPDLWTGLLVAAGFVFAAIWLRRRREPI